MEKIKTAIIGCGKVGHLHAKALADMNTAQLVAVCDNDLTRAKSYEEQYDVLAFDSIEKMVKDTGYGGCTDESFSLKRIQTSGIHRCTKPANQTE